jgi:hypothetical protein
MGEFYHSLLRHPSDPVSIDLYISLFMHTISPELYEALFNTTGASQLTLFYATLSFPGHIYPILNSLFELDSEIP